MNSILQQLNQQLAATVESVWASLVQISNGRGGQGAGTLWHKDGLIITNAHVVGHDHLTVTLPDQQTLPARLLAIDPERDLAALAVPANGLPTIELGDSRQLHPGELVLALGHPWGVKNAVSAGPVIGVGLPPELPNLHREFVQAGLQLRPGHSGGPMVSAAGRLVGVNTLITGPEVGLAIPIFDVKQFLRQRLG
ncbi:MAG: putative serine protease HtrA [Anaerolineae bacterium]|nr:putative serine protease HtrA [Anaerolineae bacterium]